MAIKLPDPGNGIPEQKTGNDEWTNMQIVRENFADRSNAASRLVGTAKGNVMEVGAFGVGRQNRVTRASTINELVGTGFSNERVNVSEINSDFSPEMANTFKYLSVNVLHFFHWGDTSTNSVLNRVLIQNEVMAIQHLVKYRDSETGEYEDRWSTGAVVYTTKNTTIGTNKELVTSSPVVRVFSDTIEAIHEANDLPLEFIRNGEGDYTLKGTTGLRNGKNDWQIIIPKDEHDNQLIAFALDEDADGTIHLKTYKRTFNMTTFMFEPDLNAPLDIPEGRWVDLHFNDLPEQTDESAI